MIDLNKFKLSLESLKLDQRKIDQAKGKRVFKVKINEPIYIINQTEYLKNEDLSQFIADCIINVAASINKSEILIKDGLIIKLYNNQEICSSDLKYFLNQNKCDEQNSKMYYEFIQFILHSLSQQSEGNPNWKPPFRLFKNLFEKQKDDFQQLKDLFNKIAPIMTSIRNQSLQLNTFQRDIVWILYKLDQNLPNNNELLILKKDQRQFHVKKLIQIKSNLSKQPDLETIVKKTRQYKSQFEALKCLNQQSESEQPYVKFLGFDKAQLMPNEDKQEAIMQEILILNPQDQHEYKWMKFTQKSSYQIDDLTHENSGIFYRIPKIYDIIEVKINVLLIYSYINFAIFQRDYIFQRENDFVRKLIPIRNPIFNINPITPYSQ